MRELKIRVHEIAVDGLPGREKTNVAFIFDGCIVSGWPLRKEEMPNFYRKRAETDPVLWEADEDVGHTRMFDKVTHWVEFSEPLIVMRMNGKDADGREYEEFGDAKCG